MKLRLLTILLLAAGSASAADPTFEAIAAQLKPARTLSFAPLDTKALEAEDAITDKLVLPERFAVGHDLELTPQNAGTWSEAKNGDLIWRLAVHAAGAVHLNFGFSRFDLPPGAELRIIGEYDAIGLGPYTERDELPHGQLWTALLRGERAILQLTVPAAKRDAFALHLVRVGHGYRGFGATDSTCKSGSCNTDVACLANSDPWNEPRRAVGAYTVGGVDTCTGSLLNNTRNDRRMLFATAGHCHVNDTATAASMVVYWNYESATCRTPGSAASGIPTALPSSSTPGLRFLAATDAIDGGGSASTRSDWTLVELATPAPGNNFNLFWAGWDRSAPPSPCAAPANASATAGLCATIHHPNVDEKRITFVEAPLTQSNYPGAATGVHWQASWDPTPPLLPNIQPVPSSLPPSVTERGSSGAPLYNAQRRMVGVLSGGPSACGVLQSSLLDYYGGLFHAWDGLGSASTRMRDYLDPDNSGTLRIDGLGATAPLAVQLDSAAFTTSPATGETIVFSASASGGNGQYTFEWDTDSDGVYDRAGSASSVSVSYPKAFNAPVEVRVRDSAGATGSASRSLVVRAASLTANVGTPAQVCGDNDGAIEPGERWRLPVTLRNEGTAAVDTGARALFAVGAASSGELPIGPNTYGYRATTNQFGNCSYGFIELAAGANAVPALATTAVNNSFGPLDDARTTNNIALGGGGFRLYGQTYTQAVMSTNGYLSFSTAETGGDFSNDCDGGFGNGAAGPQLRPLHTDLRVTGASLAGLRYRYFPTCPRQAESDPGAPQGCHVFQWNDMERYNDPPVGDFHFQAVAYERTGQITYSYQNAVPPSGPGPTIGINDTSGNDPLNVSCLSNDTSTLPGAQSAVCIFDPSAVPATAAAGVRLESPTLAVSALAPSQQVTLEVPFALSTDSDCNAQVVLDYIGTASPASFSMNSARLLSTPIPSSCQTTTACPAQIPNLTKRPGHFYSPPRSGSGLASFAYGPVYGAIWYTALPDRTPTWYLLNGPYADISGTVNLLRFRNTGAPSGYTPVGTSVGIAWVAQVDNDTLMFAWEFEGNSGAEIVDAVNLPFTSPNHTQAWYSTAESGWGISIESLVTNPNAVLEFIVGYIYDSSGTARWVLGNSNSTAGGPVDLIGYRVHCPGCPRYSDWGNTVQSAGQLTRTYTGPTSATLSTSITLPQPLNGTWNRSNLPITTIGPPAATE